MAQKTKKRVEAEAKHDLKRSYPLAEAIQIVRDITTTKFDASVDIDVRLGVDPRKANQMVRGIVTLPHGTGKVVRVLALVTPDKEEEAKAAGAEYVGLDDYIQQIKNGWTDVDVIITMPSVMPKIGALGKVLGPRGLMPNPKTGTVTMEVGKAIQEVKAGKIDFKVDKTGIIHTSVARMSFSNEDIYDNAKEVIQNIIKLKPTAAKGTYIKSLYICSTMSAGVQVDVKSNVLEIKNTHVLDRFYLPNQYFLFDTSWAVVDEDVFGNVKSFVDTYMHMDANVSGQCVGYYPTAKSAYGSLSANGKMVFSNNASFTSAYNRLAAWATYHGEVFNGTSFSSVNSNMFGRGAQNGSEMMILIVIIFEISLVALTAIVVIKRKRSRN